MDIKGFVYASNGKWVVRTIVEGRYIVEYKETEDPNAQCLTLANQFVCEVFGYDSTQRSPIAAPTAYQSFLNGHPDFIKIEGNNPNDFIIGDIIYYSPAIDPKSGAGHVGIIIGVENGKITVLEQNNPVGECTRIAVTSMKYVVGVLRHKSLLKKQRNMFYQEGKNERQVIEQVVYYHYPDGYEYFVVWFDKDGNKKLRKVVSKQAALTLLLLEAGAEERLNDWTDYNSGIPQGEDFDFANWITGNPEKAK